MGTDTPIKPATILLYNTQNIDEATLKAQFSIRKKEYKQIWQDIKTNPMDYPATHYLIQGVRGAGKTTLLARLSYAVSDDKSLNTWLIPILFNEEEYGIFSLYTFWLRIAQKLALYDASRYECLYAGLTQLSSDKEVQAWSLIRQTLIEHQQKIIVFIDNMAELFDGFTDNENAQLREVLSLHPEIRLIGGSSVILDAHFDGTAPFYQFFKLVNLKAISETETHQLLRTLAQHTSNEAVKRIEEIIAQHPERIEAVRRLTDGVPRTIVLLFQIIMEGAKDSSFAYLEETIDKTTPLYKHRMDDLTRQQQVIVNAIAMNWDAMNVKEIAEQTRLPSKTISAQLAVLQKKWVIDKIETHNKNHLYLLKERFFNIWYLMRYGTQQDRRRVLWLTKFLESWYGYYEINHEALNLAKQLILNKNVSSTLINAFLASTEVANIIKNHLANSTKTDESQKLINNYLANYTTNNIFDSFMQLHEEHKLLHCLDLVSEQINKDDIGEIITSAKLAEKFLHNDRLYQTLIERAEQVATSSNQLPHLIYLYFINDMEEKKQYALSIVENLEVQDNLLSEEEDIFNFTKKLIYLWNNHFEKARLDDVTLQLTKLINILDKYIIVLLAKNQTEMAYSLFLEFPELKEEYKPLYYAVLSFFNDERKQEFLRMGSELSITVNEIIDNVRIYHEKYA